MEVVNLERIRVVVTLCDVEFHIQQDRQCTYNVTPRRVRETIVALEKQ
jgi:hypothetical protein